MRVLILFTAFVFVLLPEAIVVSLVYHAASVRTDTFAQFLGFMLVYLVPYHLLYFAPFLWFFFTGRSCVTVTAQSSELQVVTRNDVESFPPMSLRDWAIITCGGLFMLAGALVALWFVLTDYAWRYPSHLLLAMKLGAAILSLVLLMGCSTMLWNIVRRALKACHLPKGDSES